MTNEPIPSGSSQLDDAPPQEAVGASRLTSIAGTIVMTVGLTVAAFGALLWLARDGYLRQLVFRDQAEQPAAAQVTADTAPIQVMVSPTQRLLANIGAEPVRVRRADGVLRTVGRVTIDETRRASIASRVDGRVERLDVREVGEAVVQGQRIASIYSPALLEAQQVFLTARANAGRVTGPLADPARRRLELLGMSGSAIRELERRGTADPVVGVRATASGTVVHRMVDQGQYVATGDVLFELADLSHVWVEAEVFERDLDLVSVGTHATIAAQARGSAPMDAAVSFVLPVLDPARRVARARLEVDNLPVGAETGAMLRPDQYVDVVFTVPVGPSEIVVPVAAVVRTGGLPRVWLEVEPNVFEPRLVTLGDRVRDGLVVSSGLAPRDAVVVTGTFLVDSQATLDAPHAMDLLSRGEHPAHRVPEPQAPVPAEPTEAQTEVTDAPQEKAP